MKLFAENFAAVKSAEIELNGITVLAGKNGTGKSTIGKILYSIGRTFYCAEDNVREEKERLLYLLFRNSVTHELGVSRRRLSMQSIDSMIDDYQETGEISWPEDFLPDGLDSEEIVALEKKLHDVLSIDSMEILTRIFSRTIQAEFGDNVSPVNNPRRATRVTVKRGGKEALSARFAKGREPEIQIQKAMDKEIVLVDDPNILDAVSNMEIGPYLWSRFSHRGDLKHKLTKNADETSVLHDILAEKAWSEIAQLLDELSEGDFVREKSGDYTYRSPSLQEPLSINSLSTGLKSILLLKTLVKNGSLSNAGLLIFDEPEVHLHPEWQFKLAEILVLIPKVLDIKILLSTHSTDFLSAINYYSRKHEMTEVTKYYQLQKVDGYSVVNDVSDELTLLYEDLGAPFLRVAEDLD